MRFRLWGSLLVRQPMQTTAGPHGGFVGHRMPDSHGHAVQFFDPGAGDGELNKARGLVQFRNASASAPKAGDILVFDRWQLNPYGHVAIVSRVGEGAIEIVQQNGGPFADSRETLPLSSADGRWTVRAPRALGWLRLPEARSPE